MLRQRLETYLQQNTKDLVGSVTTKPGQVVNDVQPADGKLKIYTLLNADLATDDPPAREVCRVVKTSRIPEAKGAVVVDAGDALMRRCYHGSAISANAPSGGAQPASAHSRDGPKSKVCVPPVVYRRATNVLTGGIEYQRLAAIRRQTNHS